jgi:iron complex transport system permease protein
VSFLVGAKARRLTPVRFVVTLGVCAVIAGLVVAIAPLLTVTADASGRHLGLIDLDDPQGWAIYLDGRLPRALTALVMGGALAAAGAAFQALLRNPLAEPFTLGVSSGSSLAAVIAIRFGLGGALGGYGVNVAALIGALATVYLVWQLGRVGSNLPPATLLLAGITLTMFCSAASMLVHYTADFTESRHMVEWMMGGLTDVWGWGDLERAVIPIGLGIVVMVSVGRGLNALAGGVEAAASVGVSTGRIQTVVFGVASMLVGACIALAGPIGFVGLMVPHAVRAVIGPDHRLLIPASILIGGAFLLVCDTIARLALQPQTQIPVGVVTALLGGPFFVMLLLRQKRRGELWGPR